MFKYESNGRCSFGNIMATRLDAIETVRNKIHDVATSPKCHAAIKSLKPILAS